MSKIKVKPLKSFDELNLQVASSKGFKANGPLPEELLAKIFEEVSKIPGAIIAQGKAGQRLGISTSFKSKINGQRVVLPEPNPVQIFFKVAVDYCELSKILRKEYLKIDSRNIQPKYESFVVFFEKATIAIIFLVTAIEAFFNQLIPDEIKIELNGQTLTKKDIEWKDLKTKINKILPEIVNVKFSQTNSKEYNYILAMQKLRNNLIHLQKETSENKTSYQNLIELIHDFDFDLNMKSVKTFLNTIVPDFIEEE